MALKQNEKEIAVEIAKRMVSSLVEVRDYATEQGIDVDVVNMIIGINLTELGKRIQRDGGIKITKERLDEVKSVDNAEIVRKIDA